jgi:hypothetical protein
MPTIAIKEPDAFFEKLLDDKSLELCQFEYWVSNNLVSPDQIGAALLKFDEAISAKGTDKNTEKRRGMARFLKASLLEITKPSDAEAYRLLEEAKDNPHAISRLADLEKDEFKRNLAYEKAARFGNVIALSILNNDKAIASMASTDSSAAILHIRHLIDRKRSYDSALIFCEQQMALGNPYAFVERALMHNKGLRVFGSNEDMEHFNTQAKAVGVEIELRPIVDHKATLATYGAKLTDAIQKLRAYGQSLIDKKTSSNNDRAAGMNAVVAADKLESLASKFLSEETSKEEKVGISAEFKQTLAESYRNVSTHRAIWKPILLNILIAATGIGLIALAMKLSCSGKGFFSDTTRGRKAKDIDLIFDRLDQETFKEEDAGRRPFMGLSHDE